MIAGSLTNTEEDLGKVIFTTVAATIVTLAALISDASAAIAAQADISEPFGLPTIVVSEGPWWATWRGLQSQIQSEKRIIAQCRAEPRSCTSPAALRFIALVKEGDGLQPIKFPALPPQCL
jgi:hypothetical protein